MTSTDVARKTGNAVGYSGPVLDGELLPANRPRRVHRGFVAFAALGFTAVAFVALIQTFTGH